MSIGTQAEQALLGYVIEKAERRLQLNEVSADHFSDGRMGAIWNGIANDLHAGRQIDPYSIETRFEDWGVVGLEVRSEVWSWLDAGREVIIPFAVVQVVHEQADHRYALEALDAARRSILAGEGKAGDVMHSLVRSVHERGEATHKPDQFQTYTVEDLLKMEFTDDFVIPGLLERYDRAIITGVEGYGKSTLARQILLWAAAGLHPFNSHMGIAIPLENGPVKSLVIDAENTTKQWARNLGWIMNRVLKSGSRHHPGKNMTIIPTGRLDVLKPDDLGMIHRKIDELKPDIVFVGPLYRITKGGMNGEIEAMEAIAALDTIRDRGVALLMEAHSGHAREGDRRATRPRGSSALLGWPEFGMGIRPMLDPVTKMDMPNEFELNAWRGARDADRDWPTHLRRGEVQDAFPWMPMNPLEDDATDFTKMAGPSTYAFGGQ